MSVLSEAERLRRESDEWTQAYTWNQRISEGFAIPLSSLPSGVQSKIRAIWRGEEAIRRQQRLAVKKFVEKTGGKYKPVYSGGRLTGFKDVEEGKSIGLGEFEKYLQEKEAPKIFVPPEKEKFKLEQEKKKLSFRLPKGVVTGQSVVSLYSPEGFASPREELTKAEKLRLYFKKLKEKPIETIKGGGEKVLETVGKAITFIPEVQREALRKEQTEEYKRGRWITEPTIGIPTGKGTVSVKKVERVKPEKLPFVDIGVVQKRREKELEFEAGKIYEEVAEKLKGKYLKKSEELKEKYQEKINKGENYYKITKEFRENIDKLNKQYISEVEKKATPKIKKLEKKETKYLTELSKKLARSQAIALAPTFAGIGAALGFVGGLVPAVGYGLGAYGAASTITSIPEVTKVVSERDITTLGTMGISAGSIMMGAGIGGYAGAKIRGKLIEAPKIRGAINRAKVKTKYTQILSDKKIKELQLTPSKEYYIRNLMDKGYILRKAEAKLLATNPKDAKYLPNVKSRFVEVVGRDGKIIERISLGNVITEHKGKVFSSDVYSEAIGKLSKGTKTEFIRTLVAKRGKVKPREYYEFLETSRPIKEVKKGKIRLIKGEAEIDILKKIKKPTMKDITKIYKIGKPTEAQISKFLEEMRAKGKPYGKAEIIYAGRKIGKKTRLLYGIGDISTKWQGFITEKYGVEYGKGVSFFQKIIKVKKKKVPTKPWDFKIQKVRMRKPKISKLTGKQELVYVRYFPRQKPISYGALTYEQVITSIPKLTSPRIMEAIPTALLGQQIVTRELTRERLKMRQIEMQKNLQRNLSRLIGIQAPKLASIAKLTSAQIPIQKEIITSKLKGIEIQLFTTGYAPPTINIPEGTITSFLYSKQEGRKERKKRIKEEKKLARQRRAYQASVGAVLLGYKITEEEAKRLKLYKQQFTGTELRPVIVESKKREAQKLRKQQAELLEPAIGTARKGSPRKSVRQIRKQYAEKLKRMLSYVYFDKKRRRGRKKAKTKTESGIITFSSKPVRKRQVTYNPTRQGESRRNMLKRLQNILGFVMVKKKKKKKK